MKSILLMILLSASLSLYPQNHWDNKKLTFEIEDIRDVYVFSKGVSLKVLDDYYYTICEGHFHRDNNDYFLVRSSRAGSFFDLKIGRVCQLVWPHKCQGDWYSVENSFTGKQEIGWYGLYTSLPLNEYSTARNHLPLKVFIYEHPENLEFYHDPFPSIAFPESLKDARLLIAELHSFQDQIGSISSNSLKLLNSGIYIQVGHIPYNWEKDDQLLLNYSENGIYCITNLSKQSSMLEGYLSDPAYSDISKYCF